MNSRFLFLVALFAFLSAAVGGCGKKQETSEMSSPAAATGGAPVDSATAGSISGTVQLDGAAPKMKAINMAAEPSCAKQHSIPATTEEVLVGKNNALENVVVYLKGDFSRYKFDAPATPATSPDSAARPPPRLTAPTV